MGTCLGSHGSVTSRSGSDSSGSGSLETCGGAGATCESCFGSGSIDCPGDSGYCYNLDTDSVTASCPNGNLGFSTFAINRQMKVTLGLSAVGVVAVALL